MAKHKAPKDIRDRRNQSPPKKAARLSLLPWWKWPAGFVTLLSTIAGVLTLFPRLSLDVTGSLRPQDPFGTVFAISNDGLLPVYDVHIECGIDEWRDNADDVIRGPRVVNSNYDAETFSPGDKLTAPCTQTIATTFRHKSVVSAKMTIAVTYRPKFGWWHRTSKYHVEAEHARDGTWLWRRFPR